MTINEVAWQWETHLKFLYSQREYIRGLDELLRRHDVKRVLDCSCGVGFPAIGLKKFGYDIVCTDGSSVMVKRAKSNATKVGVDLDIAVLKWHDLAKRFDSEFDTVLCRGNSLPYATSWGKAHFNLAEAQATINTALRGIYASLKQGGILYVDAAPREAFSPKHTTFIERFRTRKINGKPTRVVWRITHDLEKRIRDWHPTITIKDPANGSEEQRSMHCSGYHLSHDELLELLRSAGFSRIERYVEVQGERNYDVFIAYK